MQLADLYGRIFDAWQNKDGQALLDAGWLTQAALHQGWLSQAEGQAWQALLALRLRQTSETPAQLLAALAQEQSPWLTRLQALAWPDQDWRPSGDELQALELAHWPEPLQVRHTPLGYALAVRASSFAIFAQDLSDPHKLRDLFWPDVNQTLADYWQVQDGEDTLQLLYWLAGQGQRYAWQLDDQWLRQASESERENWRSELPEGMQGYADRLELNLELSDKPMDVAAWDWVRMADLALAGYLAGYLSRTQWRSFALVAVWLLRQRYDSWQALSEAYLWGYELWKIQSGVDLSPELEKTWQQLQTLPFSPFQQLDWGGLSLDHPDFKDAIQSFSEGLNRPLMLTALIASLRDDAALLTGLGMDRLPAERQNEAREFLFANLDVHPNESLTSTLARFWQPGRVHHYDQLALNCRVGRLPQLPGNLEAQPEVWQAWQEQAPLLADLVHFPAGVVMAEKYAFYLLKSMETGHYPLDEGTELALALQDYLSWYYPSATDLLQAWFRWDEVLSLHEEERPLMAELEWHRQDPGSLFRFFPWRRPPARLTEPGKAVSEADLATLNLVGPLTGIHWSWPERLPDHAAQELKGLLQETHLFQKPDDLIDFLSHLYHAGDRQEYLIAYAPLTLNAKRLEDEIDSLVQDESRDEDQEVHYQRLLRVQANALGVNDVDLTAWDMAQLVDLAVAGYQLGWLDDAQLHEWLARVREQLLANYTGWASMAEALLAGYHFFMNEGEQRQGLVDVFSQRLLSLLIAVPAQAGLWYTLAWPGDRQTGWERHSTSLKTSGRRLH